MTTISINKCSKCGKEARSDTEKETYKMYDDIKVEFLNRATYTRYSVTSYYLLCEGCLAKLGIVKKETREEQEEQAKDIRDRLYDIVAEIVAEIGTGS